MKGKRLGRPRRAGTVNKVRLPQMEFEEVRWRAAQRGLVLTRERRLLGAVYALTSLDGDTALLYDLREVRGHLDRIDGRSSTTP